MIKKLLVILIFLVSNYFMFGQNDQNITVVFNKTDLKEAVLQVENLSGVIFFFDESWLKDHQVTKSYDNADLKTVINGIFENTNINYFITDGKVILLNNSIVYRELPLDYFLEEILEEEVKNISRPIFQEEFSDLNNKRKRKIITIGKQKMNTEEGLFELSGYIINTKTNEPVQNLSISTTNMSKYSVTDAKGFLRNKIAIRP